MRAGDRHPGRRSARDVQRPARRIDRDPEAGSDHALSGRAGAPRGAESGDERLPAVALRAVRIVTRLVVQLSDTHIRRPGELAEGRVDSAGALARAVAAVNALPQRADAVVVTGDLVDSGKPAQYEHLRALLAPLACPVYLLPGNHDDRDALRAAFPEHTYLRDTRRAYVHYAVDVGALRLVASTPRSLARPTASIDDVAARRDLRCDRLPREPGRRAARDRARHQPDRARTTATAGASTGASPRSRSAACSATSSARRTSRSSAYGNVLASDRMSAGLCAGRPQPRRARALTATRRSPQMLIAGRAVKRA